MNHPLVLEQAEALGAIAEAGADREDSVAELFRRILQRPPSEDEIADALALVGEATLLASDQPASSPTVADWQYGYGALDADLGRVIGFTTLPHFTGLAWQGSASWPDAKLGWVQLTAAGGHPGNDRGHAAIRRWTAPRAMTINIESQIMHEPEQGDGVRAFIVSSSQGVLKSRKVHQESQALNIDSLAVSAGETIDFLVDIDKELNSDQFLWEASIRRVAAADLLRGNLPEAWNAKSDFPHEALPELSPWAQLAQVLLCANEFMYVD
jgi:hypothetical protein